MNSKFKFAVAAAAVMLATQASAEVIFYEHDDFQGRSFSASTQMTNLQQSGFNDRASSVMVIRDRWEVCEDAQFVGRCIVLRPGRYPSLSSMNLNDRISSFRNVDRTARYNDDRYAPPAYPVYDNRRRGEERTYEATVTSVRAVMGTSNQRCWVERDRVTGYQDNNVPGAIVGALIGGVLGHQVGGGRGKDVATALGAVAGASVGSNSGDGRRSYSQGVRRCENDSYGSNGRPEYWDVTYVFRNQEYRVQLSQPPGPTITVNRQGEPRA